MSEPNRFGFFCSLGYLYVERDEETVIVSKKRTKILHGVKVTIFVPHFTFDYGCEKTPAQQQAQWKIEQMDPLPGYGPKVTDDPKDWV